MCLGCRCMVLVRFPIINWTKGFCLVFPLKTGLLIHYQYTFRWGCPPWQFEKKPISFLFWKRLGVLPVLIYSQSEFEYYLAEISVKSNMQILKKNISDAYWTASLITSPYPVRRRHSLVASPCTVPTCLPFSLQTKYNDLCNNCIYIVYTCVDHFVLIIRPIFLLDGQNKMSKTVVDHTHLPCFQSERSKSR